MCRFMDIMLSVSKNNSVEIPAYSIYNQTYVRDRILELKEDIEKHSPQKLHSCPFFGDDLKEYNFSSSRKGDFEKYFPDGDYRYVHRFWNKEDANIFTSTIYEKFKTGEDEFF